LFANTRPAKGRLTSALTVQTDYGDCCPYIVQYIAIHRTDTFFVWYQTKPPTPVSLVSATHAIKRWLLRDAAVCGVGGRAHSGGRRVTVAGIHALKNLVVGFVASQETTTTTAAVPEPTTGRLGEVSGALAGKENNATTQKNRNAFQTLLSAAKEAAADAGHDPCRAVRRAGVALAFAIEWRFGGAEGPARALAVAVLACKAEPSFGARADILWDTRDGFRKRGEGDVSLSSAAVASRKWATAAVSSPDGRALAFWTTASLRAATRRSGAETASAATALLHALRGVGGWHDPADAAASAGRVAAVDAILAGAAAMTQSLDQKGNGANPLDDGGEDEAERNERRKRKEERRRAKTEKEERRKIRDARRSKRATDAVAAANEKYEIDHDHELDRGEPSAFDPSAMEPSEMLEGGSEMVLSEGTRVDTSGRDGADLDTAGDANRGTPTGGTSTGGGGGAAKEENEEVGTRDVGDVAFVEPAATEQQVHEVVSAATPAAVAATAPPPAAAPPLVGVKRERSPSAAPAPNATADTGAAPAPQPAPPPAKKPKLMFSFGAKKETVEAAAVSPLTEGEPRERKEKKEKKEKTEKKEKKEKKEKRNRGE
jgi:transcription initiation factor TFIID subunit 2